MRLIDRKFRAKESYSSILNGSGQKKLKKSIEALGLEPNPDRLEAVTGDKTHTWTRCDECNTLVVAVVELGEISDYDSRTAWVCVDCLQAALDLLKEAL